MNGLNKLRNYIEVAWPALKDHGGSTLPKWLNEIADEIESDMKENSFYASFERFAKSIDKPIEESPIFNIRKWLDYWYLPRPVIDGEPVQFGDELIIEVRPIELKERHIFEAKSIRFCNDGNAYINGFEQEQCERVQPDSIEDLKSEMIDIAYSGTDYAEEAETIVDEWLKRAKKLFKDGGE